MLGMAGAYCRPPRRASELPETLPSEYTLLHSIPRKDGFRTHSVGVYQRLGERFIIKTWRGRFKDLAYDALANEYRAITLLNSKIRELSLEGEVRVPRAYGFLSHRTSLSIVLEHIEGHNLKSRPAEEQERYFNRILSALQTVSAHLSEKDRQILATRPVWFYCLTLPAVGAVFSAYCPAYRSRVANWIRDSFRGLIGWRHAPMTLAHRDLFAENVIVRDGIAYLIDCETMALTLPFYDLAHMSIYPETSGVAEKHERWSEVRDSPLRRYIFMHAAVDIKRSSYGDRLLPIDTAEPQRPFRNHTQRAV